MSECCWGAAPRDRAELNLGTESPGEGGTRGCAGPGAAEAISRAGQGHSHSHPGPRCQWMPKGSARFPAVGSTQQSPFYFKSLNLNVRKALLAKGTDSHPLLGFLPTGGGWQEEPLVTGPSPPRAVLPGKRTPVIPTIKNPEQPFIMSGQQERQRRAEEEGLVVPFWGERGGQGSVTSKRRLAAREKRWQRLPGVRQLPPELPGHPPGPAPRYPVG